RHALSRTRGAQYAVGSTPDDDLLVVFAEAFLRDADPEDFSLEAILAHERGHQLLVREPKLRGARALSFTSEEILASLIGSLAAEKDNDREDLYDKALFEVVRSGVESPRVVRLLHGLRLLLEAALC